MYCWNFDVTCFSTYVFAFEGGMLDFVALDMRGCVFLFSFNICFPPLGLIASGWKHLTTVVLPAFGCSAFRSALGASALRFGLAAKPAHSPARLPLAFMACIITDRLQKEEPYDGTFARVRLFRLSVGARRVCLKVRPCCGGRALPCTTALGSHCLHN
jgi:hypothetical protein